MAGRPEKYPFSQVIVHADAASDFKKAESADAGARLDVAERAD